MRTLTRLAAIFAVCLSFFPIIGHAQLVINGPAAVTPPTPFQNPTGYAQINLGGPDLNASTLVNMFKGAQALPFSNGFSPTNLDIYNFIVNTTNWTGGGSLSSAFTGLQSTGPLVLLWSAQRTLAISMPASTGCTFYNVSGTPSGCSNSGFTVQTKGPSGGTVSTCGIYTVPAGTGGCAVFTLTNNPNGQNFSFSFPQTGTYAALPNGQVAGPNDLALVLGTNMPLLVSGQYWTNEFINTLLALNPKTIRTMGFSHFGNDFNNQSTWAYRATLASWSWGQNSVWPPTAWGGTLSSAGSTTYPTAVDQYSGAAATDTPGSYTDGEVWQGIVTNVATKITISGAVICTTGAGCANNTDILLTVSSTATLATNQPAWISGVSGTVEANSNLAGGLQPTIITVVDGTHIELQGVNFVNTYSGGSNPGVVGTQTVNIASRGAKFISDSYGLPFFANGATTDGFAASSGVTLVYDAKLGVMKWGTNGSSASAYSGVTPGVTGQVPWEAQAQLAGLTRSNLWVNVPAWATDGYVTNMATTLLSTLNSNFNLYLEWSNEVWNSVYPQTTWTQQVGLSFGIPLGNNEAMFSFYGYRFKQVVADFIAAGWPSSRLRSGLMSQATGNLVQTQQYRLNGVNLGSVTPTATITGINTSGQVTINAISIPTGGTPGGYTSGQALVLSGIVGTGCTFLNGRTVYVAHTPAPTTTTFVLSFSQQATTAPISTAGCTYSSGGTATPYYTSAGLPNYSSYPNRPVDVAISIGYSSYPVAANFNNSFTANNGPAMAAMQSDWIAGNTAGALALLDQDMRWGTQYNSSSNTLTFTCPTSSTTISVTNTLSSNPSYANPAYGGSNVTLGIFTTTGQTCGGIALNTVYCLTSITGSGFSVSPLIAPGNTATAGSCGSPITVTSSGASGTQTVGVTVESTFAWLEAFNQASWEWLAAQYDSDGRATPVAVELYEGGMQELAPTIAQCTTMGVNGTSGAASVTFQTTSPGVLWSSSGLQNGDRVSFTVSGGSLPSNIGSGTNYYVTNASTSGFDIASLSTAVGAIGSGFYPLTAFEPSSAGSGTVTATYCQGFDSLLNAYKQSSTYGKNYTLSEFNQFMGADNTVQNYGLMLHSRTPSWLGFTGYSEWSILPGNAVQVQNGSLPPFQTFNGFNTFTSSYP